jgi:hypothetical protein
VEIPYPANDILFIEKAVYQYELPIEYAICCYWLGKHEEAIRVNDAIIASTNTPDQFIEIARKNRRFSTDLLSSH